MRQPFLLQKLPNQVSGRSGAGKGAGGLTRVTSSTAVAGSADEFGSLPFLGEIGESYVVGIQ